MPRIATLLLLLLALAAPAHGQTPQLKVFDTDRLPALPLGPDTERFGATALGDFDGDRVTDAFVLRGWTLFYVNDLAIDGVATIVGTPLTFTDAATLRGGIEGQDACATAGSDGLNLWRFDEVAAHEALDNAVSITSQHLAAGAWENAAALCCGDVNGDGRDDIVGLSSSRESLLTMLAMDTGEFEDGPMIELDQEACSIALVDLSGDGAKEVAVASTGNSVTIVEPMPVPSLSVTSPLVPYEYPQMSCYRVPGVGDRLVAMSRVYPSIWQGVFVASGSAVEANAILAPQVGCVSIEPFDVDGDGDMDLAMNCRTAREIAIMLQDPAISPPFIAGDPSRWWIVQPGDPLSGPDPERSARLAAADVDSDGDFDLVHGDDPTASITVLRNTKHGPAPLQPHLTLYFQSLNQCHSLRLHGSFLPHPEHSVPAAATHVEIAIYHQPNPSLPATPDAIIHEVAPIANAHAVPFTLPETGTPFPDHYWLVCRYIDMENGALVWSGPPMVYKLDLSAEIAQLIPPEIGMPILVNGVIPQPGGAKGVFAKPTATGPTTNPQ